MMLLLNATASFNVHVLSISLRLRQVMSDSKNQDEVGPTGNPEKKCDFSSRGTCLFKEGMIPLVGYS